MSSLKLELIHAFGSTCSQRYQQCVAICEEDKNEVKVAFPVGKAMAQKSIDRPEMNFVPFSGTVLLTQTTPTTSKTYVCCPPEPT